ncbi:uncharacterized protein LOC128672666 [Plodia interpunctella]|uniref:uncharacterized protein LOC128672666 n=1 Tax=Plodia interpunctella TaxID=58824 RepID=UPI002367ABEB|nr:uncharacterized protein LOC128672666 [Plodia interpunctella]
MAAVETCRWVKGCLSQSSVPPGALLVGCDTDHEEVFAGRAEHEGHTVPALVIPSKNTCFISHEGEEVAVDRFEVLVPAKLCWQVTYDGMAPPAAVEAGETADGEKVYYGRVSQDGVTVPGKIQASLGGCVYAIDGEERTASEYECLVFCQCSTAVGSVRIAMRGRPYYGYGGMPPPAYGYPYPPPGPGQPYPPPHHPYPPGYPGVFYPMDPAYFYPPGGVQVVDNAEPAEIVPQLPGETVELPWSTYKWVPACLSQNSIPPGALLVGRDADDAEIYAGRARHEGDVLPAKVIPSKNACYICYGGEEILKDQFEVLVPAMFSWQFSSNGQIPPGAVEAGVTADGEKLYFGRVTHDGVTTPGKVQPSHGTCYYPFDGEEKNSNEYECLVLI